MIKSKKQMLAVIGAFILTIILGTTTYAFFNFTRTGASNTIKVGKIAFNSRQNGVINLTNVFPIDKNNVDSDTDNVGSVTINITGDTTYSDGIEYLVTAVNINNSMGTGYYQKQVPISVSVSYEENENKTIGESDKDYFDNRGGNTSLYKVLAGKTINDGNKIVVGYIAPGQTGIDGNIVIKAYIDKDNIAISDTYQSGEDTYEINPNASSNDIENCSNYLLNRGFPLQSGESYENFCNGTGTLMGMNLSQMISQGIMLEDFLNLNIIIQSVYDGTTDQWVAGRTVFTTEEWNSLQQEGISFQVKVEANEGIWVNRQGNAINELNYISDIDIRNKVIEINFDNMNVDEMHQRYSSSEYRDNITYNNEGEVLSWLEPNEIDSSKYTMYVASDGETFLEKGSNLFSYYNKAQKIIFNNVNTSRLTSMEDMFYNMSELLELDVTSFDTSNVTNIRNFVYRCTKIKKVNMSGLDLRKVRDMSGMFYSDTSLTEVKFNNVLTRDVENMGNMFYKNDNITNINLEGLGGNNLSSVSSMFQLCGSLKSVNMTNFNFGTASLASLFYNLSNLESVNLSNANTSYVENMSNMFSNSSKLENIDFTGVDTSNVNNMFSMFADCNSLVNLDLSVFNTHNVENFSSMFRNNTLLTTITVSNLWNNDSVNLSDYMFSGCTSLVGGNGTMYDANNANDITYAHIDGGQSNPGYFTLKTN